MIDLLCIGVVLHVRHKEPVECMMDLNTCGELFPSMLSFFHAKKYEINAMLKSGGGSIVNCASIYGIVGGTWLAPYVTSKHALVGLTNAAAHEFAARNIR